MVPRRGLEPLHLAALAPHASVSTNFTISAKFFIYSGMSLLTGAFSESAQQLAELVAGALRFSQPLVSACLA